ncbi:SWAP/Surp domain-containing protein [Reticulomyxa filosa]|uniref:SWAP/Surp domain-containing protein n=1 Tax=Reticulomyxa filosa TaxID=46433 RepID=X6MXN8_RETFI|nr:SWAP/Surp domain-containing protein [Reticulomyxa filosa]|eukprot:ETO18596.1 SWAP/Surp domain-containing protein [Reticulomyxa filosa]
MSYFPNDNREPPKKCENDVPMQDVVLKSALKHRGRRKRVSFDTQSKQDDGDTAKMYNRENMLGNSVWKTQFKTLEEDSKEWYEFMENEEESGGLDNDNNNNNDNNDNDNNNNNNENTNESEMNKRNKCFSSLSKEAMISKVANGECNDHPSNSLSDERCQRKSGRGDIDRKKDRDRDLSRQKDRFFHYDEDKERDRDRNRGRDKDKDKSCNWDWDKTKASDINANRYENKSTRSSLKFTSFGNLFFLSVYFSLFVLERKDGDWNGTDNFGDRHTHWSEYKSFPFLYIYIFFFFFLIQILQNTNKQIIIIIIIIINNTQNMADKNCVDSNLKTETVVECSKFGLVLECMVFKSEKQDVKPEHAVSVFVKFDSVRSASVAVQVFDGRTFDGRVVSASFFPLKRYQERDFDV